ncbi:MAG: peptidylprolyl isomerase [Lishizhenia sp.]
MALIGKIREKSWLLLVVIGVAMLAFIIPWDQLFGPSVQEDTVGIGTVNGEKIDSDQVENYRQNALQQAYQRKQQQAQGQPVQLDANDYRTAESQAWNAAVANALAIKEFEKLGLTVGEIELENILYGEEGFSPSPFLAGIKDSITGEFSSEMARQQLEAYQNQDPEGYNTFIEQVKLNRLDEKFNVLIKAGILATTVEAKDQYLATKETKNVSVLFKRFNEVTENIEISDSDAKAYYDLNKEKETYKQQASRKISYFSIPVAASADDSLKAMNNIMKLKTRFEKTKNDSLFVAQYSNNKEGNTPREFVPSDSYGGGQGFTYPAELSESIASAQIGDVVGPLSLSGGQGIGKIVANGTKTQAYVRHILLKAPESDAVAVAKAKLKADSIIAVIKANNNFEEMVTTFSEDAGSVANKGEYKYFNEGVMVPAFNDFSFQQPIGSMEAVQTNYGIHIVEVLGRRTIATPSMLVIQRPIDISRSSISIAKAEASELIEKLSTAIEDKSLAEKSILFDSLAREAGHIIRTVNLLDDSPQAAQLSQAAEGKILALAYDDINEPGLVNPFPIVDQDNLIIAYYATQTAEGPGSFELLKDRIIADARKEKQAKIIEAEMAQSQNLDVLAEKIGKEILSEGITFSTQNVTGVGREPKLVGAVFSGLKAGQVTKPIVGNNGVFVVRIDSTQPAEETTDFSEQKASLIQKGQTNAANRYKTALIEEAEVIDNRKLRQYGIK